MVVTRVTIVVEVDRLWPAGDLPILGEATGLRNEQNVVYNFTIFTIFTKGPSYYLEIKTRIMERNKTGRVSQLM